MADDEAEIVAAEPKHGVSDFPRLAEASHRNFLHELRHGFRLRFQHSRDHWRFDDAGAHGVDPDPLGRIFQACTLRQADHVDLYDKVELIPWDELQAFFDEHLPA